MLNISKNSVSEFIQLKDFKSYDLLRDSSIKRLPLYSVVLIGLGLIIFLFLPWTQNINAKGYVTTRSPEQRPQAIQSVISGRLEKWYVQEGDFIEKGDTLLFISEVKSEYFDPELLERTSEQIDAKSQSVVSYDQKVIALQNQYNALEKSMILKKEQTENKITQAFNKIKIDSIDLVAYESNRLIAQNQYARTKELYDKGLKSLTELQEKEYKLQSIDAKVDVQKNKLLNQRNMVINLKLDLTAIERDFDNKLAKVQSDVQSALSAKLESMAATSKLKNQYSNYNERQKFYYITAPQSGYVTKTIKKGIGETIKEGTDILTIMPDNYDLAAEIYILPQDLPLINKNNKLKLRFDGWPAIVISGWPESATGVFSGEVVVIDRFISENGYYRILVSPDELEKEWPETLSIGTGANAFILLEEVPIWYEIWRQLNGFPADYYKADQNRNPEVKRKAPIKSVK